MGELRTRKRGKTWEYSFEGAKIDGKRKPISKGGFRTKADALNAGIKAKAEYDSGGRVFTPSAISLSDYLDYWYKRYASKLTYKTQDTYKNHIRLHIKPYLGSYRISILEPDVIQEWVDEVLHSQKKLARQSIANILGVLSGALNYAVQPLRYIRSNPCIYVKIPDIKVDKKAKDHTDFVLSKEDWKQIKEYFSSAPESHSYLFFPLIVGYHTGERIGEIFGTDLLADYNPVRHTLSVSHQLQKQKGILLYTNPKYDSFRINKIDSLLEAEIQKELKRRECDRLRYREYYKNTYLLPDNTIIQLPADSQVPDSYQEIWPLGVKQDGTILTTEHAKHMSRIVKDKVGIELFHPHCLRHTHGTILAQSGASPKTIMERLGHKNIKVTMERYVFNTEEMQNQAVSLFENAIK